jgi:hypothetical protein
VGAVYAAEKTQRLPHLDPTAPGWRAQSCVHRKKSLNGPRIVNKGLAASPEFAANCGDPFQPTLACNRYGGVSLASGWRAHDWDIGTAVAYLTRSAFVIGLVYTLSAPEQPRDAYVPASEPAKAVAAAIEAIRRDPEAARLAAQLALAAMSGPAGGSVGRPAAEPDERVQLRALVAEIVKTPHEMLSAQR